MIDRRVVRTASAIAVAGLAAGPLAAAPWVVEGLATLRAGVEKNPYLRSVPGGSEGAAGVAGLTVNGTLSQDAARSKTALIGSAEVAQYSRRYGRNTNYLAGLSRTQQLSERLQVFGQATYTSTINPQSNFGFDSAQDTATIDYLTVGTRSQRIDGNLSADWRPTAKDTFRLGATASHATYSAAAANRNDQYGANFSYLRTVGARTSLGVQLSASSITASSQPSAQSYEANLLVVRQISAIWAFDGGIGLIKQRSDSVFASNRITIGFNGSLCGTYPRSSICLVFSRQSAPSGIGGLRTDTRIGLNASHALSERSRLTLNAAFNDSTSRDTVLVPRQRYYDATVGYSRDITQRIAIGASARYQRRQTNGSFFLTPGTQIGSSLVATASYAFGHRGS